MTNKKYHDKLCKCGCGNKIEIKPHHRYNGVPEYICGHHLVNRKGVVYVKKILKICKFCNDSFYIYPSSTQILCSRKCSDKSRIGVKIPANSIRTKQMWKDGKFDNFVDRQMKGENNPAKRLEVGKRISEKKKEWHKNNKEKDIITAKKMVATRRKNNTYVCSEEQRKKIGNALRGREVSEENRKNCRIARIKYIEKNCKGVLPNLGKNEKRILDEIEKTFEYKIIRQYPVCGYYVDGYIKELNLVIEIDELHHFDFHGNLKEKDSIRQNNIEEELNCKFLRIKDKF